MRDLQRRLAFGGHLSAGAEIGTFCGATETAVARFQTSRGLRPTGACDELTWAALVEAGWSLGDRLLKLTSPHMRGDDVSMLQADLGRLGFDAGRVDGIFGTKTATALLEFQRSCGMAGDGVCGPETLRLLTRLGRQSGQGPGVSSLREEERWRALPRMVECRVVIGQFGGLSSLTRATARAIRSLGVDVVLVDEPDALAHAEAANRFHAHAYIGFEASFEAHSSFYYYGVPAFESTAGRALADSLGAHLGPVLVEAPTIEGIRLPVLRETRMPAVSCRLGPVRRIVDDVPVLAAAIAEALRVWIEAAPTDSTLT